MFLRSGFHGASLDDISLEAGYTTGAVYSRFGGKDALFLAVLDDHIERRLRRYMEAADAAPDFESAGREMLRAAVAAGREEPGWTPLLMEFWTHAARREELREPCSNVMSASSTSLAELYEEIGAREGWRSGARPARSCGLTRRLPAGSASSASWRPTPGWSRSTRTTR